MSFIFKNKYFEIHGFKRDLLNDGWNLLMDAIFVVIY